jgi:malonate transporter and related proteins
VEATINIIAPIFGLILCGFLVAKSPILDKPAIVGINNFVFFVAIPCLLFRSMAKGVSLEVLDPQIDFAYFGGSILLFVAAMFLSKRVFGLSLVEQAVFAMGSIFSNTVMLGIPLVYMAFGDEGLLAIMLIIAFHAAILIPLATIVVEVGNSRGGAGRILISTAKALAKNPVILGLLVGLLWGLGSLPVPVIADRFIGLLAGAAAPCALFALGAAISEYKIAGELRESVAIVFLKLVIHPIIIWALASFVFDLSPVFVAVATITAALPVGANVYILAQKYEIYVARSASSVLLSTGISVVTVALLVGIFTS